MGSKATTKILQIFYLQEETDEKIEKIINKEPKSIFTKLYQSHSPSEGLEDFTIACFAFILKFYRRLDLFATTVASETDKKEEEVIIPEDIHQLWGFSCFFAQASSHHEMGEV